MAFSPSWSSTVPLSGPLFSSTGLAVHVPPRRSLKMGGSLAGATPRAQRLSSNTNESPVHSVPSALMSPALPMSTLCTHSSKRPSGPGSSWHSVPATTRDASKTASLPGPLCPSWLSHLDNFGGIKFNFCSFPSFTGPLPLTDTPQVPIPAGPLLSL